MARKGEGTVQRGCAKEERSRERRRHSIAPRGPCIAKKGEGVVSHGFAKEVRR
jgi:hypothetical protein